MFIFAGHFINIDFILVFIITNNQDIGNKRDISFSQELLRKGIHLISLSIPVLYIYLDQTTSLYILLPLTFLFVVADVLSKFKNPVRYLVYKFFRRMLRPHETGDKFVLNGASWVLISATICVLIFPKVLTVVSFSILIISDIFAAIIGKRYGKNKLFVNKTWEGTFAFIVTAIITVFVYGFIFSAPLPFFIFGCIAAIAGGFIEALSPLLKIDDNLSIPLSIGLLMWIAGLYSASIGHPFLNLI